MITSKFYLQNEIGETKSLNLEDSVFFKPVGGLGITETIDLADLQDGFFSQTQSKIPQNSITGNLVFKRGAFANYAKLVDWVMSSNELDFIYVPQETLKYHRRVKMVSLTKTIRDSAGWSEMPVSFLCFTPWFLATSPSIEFTAGQASKMRFPIVFSSDLRFSASLYGAASAVVSRGGHMPASWKLRYSGYMLNPVITVTGYSSGTEYGKCVISGVIGATDTLELSTLYLDSHVKRITSEGAETDLINDSSVDIAYDPFARIPTSEDCVLKIAAENTLDGLATITVNHYYRSV